MITLFRNQTAQVFFVPGQMSLNPTTVWLGLHGPSTAKVPPQLLDRFHMDLEHVRHFDLCEFTRLAGRDNAAS